MPYLPSDYRPPWGFNRGHLQTVYPAIARRVPVITTQRERIPTPDGDFLDLDWSRSKSRFKKVAILSHGLEGSSRATYIQGLAQALRRRGWQVVAWNCRGCSGEPNRKLRFYHSGATDDLRTVVRHVLQRKRWDRVVLAGFSLGGNLTLKFLGEEGEQLAGRITRAVAFSVPCDLEASSRRLEAPENRLYMQSFLRSLRRKIEAKAARYPRLPALDLRGWDEIRTFKQFDDRFTAPLHGFANAEDYWERASSRPFLPGIRVPSLLINALDDPFLAEGCFPRSEADANHYLHLETPRSGGHVGFVTFGSNGEYWSETRALQWLDSRA